MRFLFKPLEGKLLKIFSRLVIYLALGMVVFQNHQIKVENDINVMRFHKHITETEFAYIPINMDKYIKILEDFTGEKDLSVLKSVCFYSLVPSDLELACNFQKGPDWMIYGCYHPYIKTIFVRNSEFASCDTELHELAHAAIDYLKPYGSATAVMNSLHKHDLFKNDQIEKLCISNNLL